MLHWINDKIRQFLGIVSKQAMAENPLRVQAKANELNLGEPGSALGGILAPAVPPVWQAIPGYFALTGFDFNKGKGGAIFNANFGVPIKVFQNSRTGEIRIFSAYLFETD